MPLDAPIDAVAAIRALYPEAVVLALLLPGSPGAKKAGLFNKWPAILWAERIAIATLVAEIGEVANLSAFLDVKLVRFIRQKLPACQPIIPIDKRNRLNLEDKVRIIWADRQAFIAGETVKKEKVAVDFARFLAVLYPAIARVIARLLGDNRRIEQRRLFGNAFMQHFKLRCWKICADFRLLNHRPQIALRSFNIDE